DSARCTETDTSDDASIAVRSVHDAQTHHAYTDYSKSKCSTPKRCHLQRQISRLFGSCRRPHIRVRSRIHCDVGCNKGKSDSEKEAESDFSTITQGESRAKGCENDERNDYRDNA